MRRNRSRRLPAPAGSLVALDRWHPLALGRAIQDGRVRVVGAGAAVLVTSADDELEIAQAAWRILAASGGLIDRGDIARRFGLSRGRVYNLTTQRHFPAPVGKIGGRPVWLAAAVERYRSQPPPVGRPRKDDSDRL
jgi:predicted DNA-binding transcriptional regulator AlpA